MIRRRGLKDSGMSLSKSKNHGIFTFPGSAFEGRRDVKVVIEWLGLRKWIEMEQLDKKSISQIQHPG
jgi:hypothetical protein